MDNFSDTPPLPSTDWDVLISGTGIKQSLLAVALGRAGKSVLQLDKNSYYGGSSAAFYSLSEADAWAVRVNNGGEVGVTNAVVSNAVAGGNGRGYTLTLAPHLVYWHSDVLGMLRKADLTEGFSWHAVGSWWVFLTDGDVAVSAAVPVGGIGLAEVGVKAAKLAAVAEKKGRGWNKGRKKEVTTAANASEVGSGAGEAGNKDGETALRKVGDFREVPCTFEDVAWSSDLTDKDRGQLGEFLRFVMKHDDPADLRYSRIFEENRKTSLETFLSTTFPIPPFIITSISSLALSLSHPSKITLEQAIPRLAAHFASLGKISDVRSSAALTIAYGGSAELCQVLSRAAAIAGGVNVLGRGVKSLSPGKANGSRKLEAHLESGERIYTDWAIGEASDLAKEAAKPTSEKSTARGIFIIDGEMRWLLERKYKDETISPAVAIAIVPGKAGGAPVYVTARSAATGECPRGHCLLYAFTESSYEEMSSAVERLLNTSSPSPKTLYSLRYTVATVGSGTETEEGAVILDPLSQDIALQNGLLEEALKIYEKIVGTREGFMDVPEEVRRMKEMEE